MDHYMIPRTPMPVRKEDTFEDFYLESSTSSKSRPAPSKHRPKLPVAVSAKHGPAPSVAVSAKHGPALPVAVSAKHESAPPVTQRSAPSSKHGPKLSVDSKHKLPPPTQSPKSPPTPSTSKAVQEKTTWDPLLDDYPPKRRRLGQPLPAPRPVQKDPTVKEKKKKPRISVPPLTRTYFPTIKPRSPPPEKFTVEQRKDDDDDPSAKPPQMTRHRYISGVLAVTSSGYTLATTWLSVSNDDFRGQNVKIAQTVYNLGLSGLHFVDERSRQKWSDV